MPRTKATFKALFPLGPRLQAGLLACLLGAVNATAAEPRLAFTLAHPGEVLFVRDERLAQLRRLEPGAREQLCGAQESTWPSYRARTTVRRVEGYGGDEKSEPFAWAVMRAAADAFGTGDGEAKAALVGLLRRWADGRALTKLEADDPASHYVVERTLLPTIVAYGLVVRDDPEVPAETRALIDDWLAGLVARTREYRIRLRSEDISARNNHAYLAASVLIAWGALVGDPGLVETAVAVYRRAIVDMRPDGSLPLETMRGARALWYQRHAIASLVTIAQIAEVQGIDLWDYRVGERDIHRAVQFLLDAIADPKLVWPYAQQNVNPGPSSNWLVQDLGFLKRRGHGRHYMAWAEIYMARFPEREESQRLASVLARFEPEFRPMIDEYSGGNTSCFFYRPTALAAPVNESSIR
ncbi:Polysaccharide lyase [bacterium HR40]|nr:Polysaccharide lyase [bacterium HR40]